MATKKQLEAARKLLDLDVSEVSLVDKPANLREFLLVKRAAEGSNLGEFEVEEAVEWLEKMAANSDAPKNVLDVLTQSIAGGSTVDPTTETVEMAKARHAYEVETCKAGKTEETLEFLEKRHAAELEEVTKNAPPPPAEPPVEPEAPEPPAEPVAKTETPPAAEPPAEPAAPEEAPMVVVKADGSVHVSGQTVQKAKTFGKAKTATLQNAVSALAKLLGDVSEDALKAAMSPYLDPTKKVATSKAAEPPPPAEEPTPTADPAEVVTKAVAAALEPITKRLEEIEKTRNPSQSIEGAGGTDTTAKVEKSMWNGII